MGVEVTHYVMLGSKFTDEIVKGFLELLGEDEREEFLNHSLVVNTNPMSDNSLIIGAVLVDADEYECINFSMSPDDIEVFYNKGFHDKVDEQMNEWLKLFYDYLSDNQYEGKDGIHVFTQYY